MRLRTTVRSGPNSYEFGYDIDTLKTDVGDVNTIRQDARSTTKSRETPDQNAASLPLLHSDSDGDDTLLRCGDDVLSGAPSADLIDGGSGMVHWLEKADTNFTVAGFTVTSAVTGSETAMDIERIVLIGGSQVDLLSGGNRNDASVAGGDGADTLNGGPADDIFTLLPTWVDAI